MTLLTRAVPRVPQRASSPGISEGARRVAMRVSAFIEAMVRKGVRRSERRGPGTNPPQQNRPKQQHAGGPGTPRDCHVQKVAADSVHHDWRRSAQAADRAGGIGRGRAKRDVDMSFVGQLRDRTASSNPHTRSGARPPGMSYICRARIAGGTARDAGHRALQSRSRRGVDDAMVFPFPPVVTATHPSSSTGRHIR